MFASDDQPIGLSYLDMSRLPSGQSDLKQRGKQYYASHESGVIYLLYQSNIVPIRAVTLPADCEP